MASDYSNKERIKLFNEMENTVSHTIVNRPPYIPNYEDFCIRGYVATSAAILDNNGNVVAVVREDDTFDWVGVVNGYINRGFCAKWSGWECL